MKEGKRRRKMYVQIFKLLIPSNAEATTTLSSVRVQDCGSY